jgi:hypothetical protein
MANFAKLKNHSPPGFLYLCQIPSMGPGGTQTRSPCAAAAPVFFPIFSPKPLIGPAELAQYFQGDSLKLTPS